MVRKAIVKKIKLQIEAGKATPGPPIGSILGPHGINLPMFCRDYNDQTKNQAGSIVPVEITIYQDRTFTFELGVSPMSDLIKRAAGIEKGSGEPNREKIGMLTRKQVAEIAQKKIKELNAYDVESAMKIVEGSARSMGVEIEG
ncbi:50S ribosomal protein L11 [bacterium]|nr:50S ribosomal protein L11 [bacterium]